MSRLACLGVAAAMALALPVRGAEADAFDLTCFAGHRPLLLRLHVRLDDKPLSSAWDAYLTALLAFLDRDGDGVLNEAEARRAPSPDQLLRQFENGFSAPHGAGACFADMDADRDHKVTAAELAAYYRAAGVGPLRLVTTQGRGPAEAALTEALFAHLDQDRDGKLSQKELGAASGLLRKLDGDDDERLSAEELAPCATRRKRRVPSASAEKLPRLAISRAKPASADHPPDIELSLRLGTDGARKAPLEFVKPSGARKSEDGSIQIVLEGVRVESRVEDNAGEAAGIRPFYLQQFRAADKDHKGRLMLEDVDRPAFRLLHALFPAADRDGDGKLTEKELNDYFDLHAKGSAAYVTLAVEGRRAGLFELLDADGDGRLSIHELTTAQKRLAPFDLDGDGRIAHSELPYRFRFVFGRGRPRLLPALTETPARPVAGPPWFRLLDRNDDGYLSPREFPGSPEDFKRLDANGDGLIGAEEAEKADRKKTKNSGG
ncbi:MAG TPA: EF-hand domain-containing protein [Gemmataceae bacterium]|jgi:Ca2+-binding EF-hand superfamily protein